MGDERDAQATGDAERIGKIAHDLNNLLTVIESYTALAEFGLPDGHAARADLETIRGAAQKANVLVRELGVIINGRCSKGERTVSD